MTRRVAIVGLGLIGGSLGMSLRRAGWDVSFVDPNVDEADAISRDAANRKLQSIPNDVDLIVLATPVDVALRTAGGAPAGPRAAGPLYTSTCSVMFPLVRVAQTESFIAGHPLAGSEKRGLGAARADLFEGKRWFIHRGDALVEEMIGVTGATPYVVDAEEHDRAIAFTSHLPQLLSTALASLLAEKGPSMEPFFGSGLATVLRLAGSDHSVWESVFATNRENISAASDELFLKMRELGGDDFRKAQELWRKLVDV